MNDERGHGEVSKAEPPFIPFTMIGEKRATLYDADKLAALAMGMAMDHDDLSDGPDPEENLFVPAGYTYLGQFIDHDLTLDTTSTLNPEDLKDPAKPASDPSNLRSPRFDLDCVYGNGPADQPYMYAAADQPDKGIYRSATLVIGRFDLARAANGLDGAPGRAIIGDKRNDENSIVNQIQQAFIRFHNTVVANLAKERPALRGEALFKEARDQVRWSYQQIILDDFLPRIVDPAVLDNFKQTRHYELYPDGPLRKNLPREFVAAAYRFGHSAVRTGYRLQGGSAERPEGTRLPIFTNPPAQNADDSLVGFDPLPRTHVIDHWGRFFPADLPRPGQRLLSNAEAPGTGDDRLRLQFAYKLDTSLTDPLANLPPKIAGQEEVFPASVRNLEPPKVDDKSVPKPWGPSLALLNLLRGNRYQLPGGQAYEPMVSALPLDEKYLCVRHGRDVNGSKRYSFTPISDLVGPSGNKVGDYFKGDTPLWFYILAEAQRPLVDHWLELGRDLTEDDLMGYQADGTPVTLPPDADAAATRAALKATRCTGTQLGPVGGRLVTEVFYGLMESDPDSVLAKPGRKPAGWVPPFGAGPATMAKLLRYIDPQRAPA